ncbi:MAG: hypothetical protein AB1798_21310, partial [Spirochaetota bacterium]
MRIAILILLFSVLVSCIEGGKRTEHEEEVSGEKKYERWYHITENGLKVFSDFSELPVTAMQPWTIQRRISGFLQVKNFLYGAVNGLGIMTSMLDNKKTFNFEIIKNAAVFSRRTIGKFFFQNNKIFCHFYRDTLLSTTSSSIAATPVSIAYFYPGKVHLKILTLPYQEENPGWELVDLMHNDSDKWILAWKYSDPVKTLFRYTMYSNPQSSEVMIDRKTYLETYNFTDVSGAPAQMVELSRKLPKYSSYGVTIITIRYPEYTQPKYYINGSAELLKEGNADLLAVSAFLHDDTYLMPFPDNKVYWTTTSGQWGTISLPR